MRRPRSAAGFLSTFAEVLGFDIPGPAERNLRALAEFAAEFALIYAFLTEHPSVGDVEAADRLQTEISRIRIVRRQMARDRTVPQ